MSGMELATDDSLGTVYIPRDRSPVMTCTNCTAPIVKRRKDAGVHELPPGHRWHAGYGMCGQCYNRTIRKARPRKTEVTRTCVGLTEVCECKRCTAPDHESPRILTGGAWVKGRHGIRVWRAAP